MADALTRDDVVEIAHLARMALTDDEITALKTELSAILVHMEALATIDVEGVEPMTHAVPMELRLRADEIESSLPADSVLSAAPAQTDSCFQVPHIIKTAAEQDSTVGHSAAVEHGSAGE